jgi:hypothetical protein
MPTERTTGLMLLTLAVAIGGSVAGYVFANSQPEVVRDADRCPPKPVAATFALVDITDAWPRSEQERIANGLLATAARVRKNERLSLYIISTQPEQSAEPWKSFQRCKSADPAAVNPMQENQSLVEAEYEEHFLAPLKALLPALIKGSTAPQSPILQALEIIMWSPHFRSELPQRTLEIYSDLLQHTASLSHLTGRLPDPCTVLESEIGRRLKGHDWRGVRVNLYYLRNPRDGARQGEHHKRWWVTVFYLLGAPAVYDGDTALLKPTESCAPRHAQRNR